MELRLVTLSRSFATRERARELVESIGASSGDPVTIDISGVMVSPSFLAELLGLLYAREAQVTVVGGDSFHMAVVARLIQQLGLADRVQVAELTH